MIEGGQDPSQAAAYHPFYITDDPEGGYEFMTEARKRKVRTFKKDYINNFNPTLISWNT